MYETSSLANPLQYQGWWWPPARGRERRLCGGAENYSAIPLEQTADRKSWDCFCRKKGFFGGLDAPTKSRTPNVKRTLMQGSASRFIYRLGMAPLPPTHTYSIHRCWVGGDAETRALPHLHGSQKTHGHRRGRASTIPWENAPNLLLSYTGKFSKRCLSAWTCVSLWGGLPEAFICSPFPLSSSKR